MQSWDGWIHANPTKIGGGEEGGVGMIFNPTDVAVEEVVSINLYYTGLTDVAKVIVDDGEEIELTLNRDYSVDIQMKMEPRSVHTLVIR